MAESGSVIRETSSVGDAAVDGLFGGLAAGVLMAIFLVLAGLTVGARPGITMRYFDATGGSSPFVGSVLHLAVSGVYGLTFGILYRLVAKRVPGWLAGLIYGTILFWVAWGLLLPATDSTLLAIPFWQFGVGHLVYGAMLGVVVGR